MEIKKIKFSRSSRYDANIELYGNNSNTCERCGKATAQKQFIHYTTYGYIVNTTSDEELSKIDAGDSQGFMPIGPECAKKYPKEFIFD